MTKQKKYRVNESEVFNLESMYEHLQCMKIEAEENNDFDALDKIYERLEEVENLLDAAPRIGCLVTWPKLKRIREIRDERNMIRYSRALENGASDFDAGYAIM